jgi:hypothetical protein
MSRRLVTRNAAKLLHTVEQGRRIEASHENPPGRNGREHPKMFHTSRIPDNFVFDQQHTVTQ